MFRVEPYALWLGHAGDCRDVASLFEAGIRASVQLAIEEPPVALPRDFIVVRIPLYDGSDNSADNLQLAVNTVQQLLTSKTPTLVSCGAGMSRSPAIAAFALARIENRTPAQSLEMIQSRHGTDVSATLWHDLQTCLNWTK